MSKCLFPRRCARRSRATRPQSLGTRQAGFFSATKKMPLRSGSPEQARQGPAHCTADSHSPETLGFSSDTSMKSTTAARAARTTSASGTCTTHSTRHPVAQTADRCGGSPAAKTTPPTIPSCSLWGRHLRSVATAPMALSRNPSGPTTSCASKRCRSRRSNLSPPKALDAVHTRALSQAATARVVFNERQHHATPRVGRGAAVRMCDAYRFDALRARGLLRSSYQYDMLRTSCREEPSRRCLIMLSGSTAI